MQGQHVLQRSERSQKRWPLLIALALIVLPLAVYWQTLDFEFVYDDAGYVVYVPQVLTGLSSENIAWACTTNHHSNWHPLTWMSLMFDAERSGSDPGGFHLTNVVLHTINGLLLFAVLCQMTRSMWQSALVAALFAVHPLHVESVAWVSERKDVLSGFFGLLALGAYGLYVRRSSWTWYSLSLIAFVLSLLSKQMLVTLPFLLLLLDAWPLQRTGDSMKKLLLEKVPFLVISVVFSAAVFLVQDRSGTTAMLEGLCLTTRCLNAVLAYALYLVDTVWPSGLAALYPHPGDDISLPAVAASAVFLATITVVAVVQWTKRPYLLVGWFWFLGTLVPVIGIVQIGTQQRADRYTYIPLVGIFIALSWLVMSVMRPEKWRKHVVAGLTVSVLVLLTAVAWKQTGYWRTDFTLFERALAVTERNAQAHVNVGSSLARSGRTDEAMHHFREALQIDPDDVRAHYNYANALGRMGHNDEAISHYREALRLVPDYAEAHVNLGLKLSDLRLYKEAVEHFRRALDIKPRLANAHFNLGNTLVRLHRHNEAIQHYNEAIRINPGLTGARQNLEMVRRKMSEN